MTDRPARRLVLLAALLAAACGPREPVHVTRPGEAGGAPVVRSPGVVQPPTSIPPVASAAPTATVTPPPAGIVVPADAIYVCVTDNGGQQAQTVIAFAPNVHALCRRHPEMGPCQYERNVCRSAGGRVFAANGQEITMATEAEYDRKVMRVRFRSN